MTLWGLHDGRSWRSAEAPLLFDASLKAKPAYFGAVDGELDARLRTAFVFQGSVPLDAAATGALAWQQLPLHRFGDDKVGFQLRWEPDHLTAVRRGRRRDPAGRPTPRRSCVDDATFVVRRDGTGDVPRVVDDGAGGWKAVVHLPLSGAAIGDQLAFDVSVADGSSTVGWNDAGATGTLTLVEPLSFTDVAEAATAPVIDGETDAAWAAANTVSTDKQVEGTGGASAVVRTLWQDNTLYVLAHVTDPILDDTGSDPWIEDSVEIYVDAGNVKNGSYRFDDTQIRINYNNVTSFGTGDEAFQANRLESATKVVADGYVVEASISLLEAGGVGTFHGLDFQVNDATAGARTSIRNWADPTGLGYQSTSRWGVGRLVARDATVPELAFDSPLHLTATHADGYHGLTAEIAGVTASDAFDDPSALTITSDAPAVLPVGTTVVTWTVTDPAGNSSSAPQTVIVAARVATSIEYAGSTKVQAGKAATFGVVLSASDASCVGGVSLVVLVRPQPAHGRDRRHRARRRDDQRRRPGEADRRDDRLEGRDLPADGQLRRQRPRVCGLVDDDGDHGHQKGCRRSR